MRPARLLYCTLGFALTAAVAAPAQQKTDGPTDEKARKSYDSALKYIQNRQSEAALEDFKKADKQDGGHCRACQRQMLKLGKQHGDWKAVELAATEMVAEASDTKEGALAHYEFAIALRDEGLQRHKDEYFTHAHEEAGKALSAYPNFPGALYVDGIVLAQLHRDEESKAQFEQFTKMKSVDETDRRRAIRYIARPELARARMVPAFAVNTLDGRQISMDDLQGKVVLVDFWATWCAPCREALPHIQRVARKFQGEPLVILSVSLDSDEQKWKEFVGKNEMTWPQYRDGSFSGPIARMFSVNAIPHTFTIDADGVLQEEHIGDASIEGKLKKLIAHAHELQSTDTPLK